MWELINTKQRKKIMLLFKFAIFVSTLGTLIAKIRSSQNQAICYKKHAGKLIYKDIN